MMLIKTTVRYHFIPFRLTKKGKAFDTNTESRISNIIWYSDFGSEFDNILLDELRI